MDPVTASVLAQVGAQVGGQILGSVLGGEKQTPDYGNQAINAAQDQFRRNDQDQRRAMQRLQGNLNAAGATGFQGTAARNGIARAGAERTAQVRARALDQITRAQMQEERARTRQHNRQVDQRRSAVYNLTSAASSVAGSFTGPAAQGANASQGAAQAAQAGANNLGMTDGGVPLQQVPGQQAPGQAAPQDLTSQAAPGSNPMDNFNMGNISTDQKVVQEQLFGGLQKLEY